MTELVWPTPLFSPALLLTTDHAANHVSSLTKILINLVAIRQSPLLRVRALPQSEGVQIMYIVY